MIDPFIIYGGIVIGVIIGAIFLYLFGWGVFAAIQKRKAKPRTCDNCALKEHCTDINKKKAKYCEEYYEL